MTEIHAEQRRDLRGLAIQAGVFLAILAAADVFLGFYAPGHFVPEQKLAAAVVLPGEVRPLVVTGDSRMVAAADFRVLEEGLKQKGVTRPLADLTLGAVDCTGQAVTYRAYRAKAPAPAAVVMGVSGDSLLDPTEPLEPDLLVGNQAVVMVLSRPGDLLVHYPGFPLADLDRGLRFGLGRLTAMGVYRSLLWMKVRVIQDRIAGRAGGDNQVNEFGLVGDMANFAATLRARADERLRAARLPDGKGWRFNPWFERFRASLREDRVPLVLVELPMPSSYRENVTRAPGGRALQEWIKQQAEAEGGTYLDLSDGPALGLTDDDFPDRLHMTHRAAELVSTRLAEELGRFLARKNPGTAAER
ncbi:MAG: SGNH/GDSL hydrolase family protein [Isosphaeraceae bacterium]